MVTSDRAAAKVHLLLLLLLLELLVVRMPGLTNGTGACSAVRAAAFLLDGFDGRHAERVARSRRRLREVG